MTGKKERKKAALKKDKRRLLGDFIISPRTLSLTSLFASSFSFTVLVSQIYFIKKFLPVADCAIDKVCDRQAVPVNAKLLCNLKFSGLMTFAL